MTYLTESSESLGIPLSKIKEADPTSVIDQARIQVFSLFQEVDRRLSLRTGKEWNIAYHLYDVAVDGTGNVVITFDEQIRKALAKYDRQFVLLVEAVFTIDNTLFVTIIRKPLSVKIHSPDFVYKRE